MMVGLEAVAPGFFVTIQDGGRYGWRRFGVPRSGAIDQRSLAAANALVGNAPDEAALEFAYEGGTWQVGAGVCRIAVTGGDFLVSIDGWKVPSNRSHTIHAGQRVAIGGARCAVWGYFAVGGGFDLRPELGSHATYARSAIGGWQGRVLAAGDVLPLRGGRASEGPELRYVPPPRPACAFRVVMGPQDDFFTPDGIAAFLSADYEATHQGDRMGYRLAGPDVTHAKGFNIITDGLVPGSIQVPGNGQPIVLLMDCQTTGGYPKVATLITPDLGWFAQCRPGTKVRFAAVDVHEAQRLAHAYHARLAAIEDALEPIAPVSRRSGW